MNIHKNKILTWVMYIALCIIPFLAFYVSGFGINAEWNAMLFPYITGKNFSFRILVEIAAACWILLMILDKSFRPKKSILLWIYTAFVGILFLADIFSVNITRSFFSNFERMEGFISHAHLFLYFLMLITLLKDKVQWEKYRFILFISNIPVLLLALVQLLGLPNFGPMKYLPALRDAIHSKFAPTQGGNQLDASLGNSTYLAIYTVFFIFLFFISYLENRAKKSKGSWVYLLMMILNIVVLFYTQTRGAQIGFAIGVFVSALILFFGGRKFKDLKNKRKISLAIIIIAVLGYIALISFGNSSFIKNSGTLNKLAKVSSFANPVSLFSKISKIKSELYNPNATYQDLYDISGDGTFTSRLLNIKMALSGFKDRPILGWGQDNYFYVFAKHNDARMYAQEPWFDRTHNVFMDWLIAGGIIGLLAYLALYVGAIYTMWSKNNRHKSSNDFTEKALLTGLLIAYFIHNIFVFDNLVSYLLFFFVLAYIAVRFDHKEHDISTKSLENNTKSKLIIYSPIVLVCLALSLYFFNIRYIQANRYIIQGLTPKVKTSESPIDALNRSLDYFKKSVNIGGIAELESREQLAQNTLSLLSQIKSANIPQTEEYMSVYKLLSDSITLTKDQYTRLLTNKSDPRSLSIFATFLRNVGDNASAIKYSEMAYNMAPNKQTIVVEYIQSLLNNEKYSEANTIAQKMYESDKSYDLAKQVLAITYIYTNKFVEGEKLLTNIDGSVVIDQNVAGAYLSINQENRLISVLQKNIIINPKDVNSVAILADIYVKEGDNNTAISLLRDLEKVSPDLKTKIEEYISSISKK